MEGKGGGGTIQCRVFLLTACLMIVEGFVVMVVFNKSVGEEEVKEGSISI
jgi:hypothetical protein